jgi:hypothetical protein
MDTGQWKIDRGILKRIIFKGNKKSKTEVLLSNQWI